jgi:hypothetical protein
MDREDRALMDEEHVAVIAKFWSIIFRPSPSSFHFDDPSMETEDSQVLRNSSFLGIFLGLGSIILGVSVVIIACLHWVNMIWRSVAGKLSPTSPNGSKRDAMLNASSAMHLHSSKLNIA